MRRIFVYVDDDGWWVATCPSLPGCNTQGATRAEAIANMHEAMSLYIEVIEESGREVPEDRTESEVVVI